MSYNPDQPRVPEGNETGGQWTSDGSTAAMAARKQTGLIPQYIKYGVDVAPKTWWAVYKGKVYYVKSGSLYDNGHEGIAKKLGLPNTDSFDVRGYSGIIRPGRPGAGMDVLVFYKIGPGSSENFAKMYVKIADKIKMPDSFSAYATDNDFYTSKIWKAK
jgi:hypothetical protein